MEYRNRTLLRARWTRAPGSTIHTCCQADKGTCGLLRTLAVILHVNLQSGPVGDGAILNMRRAADRLGQPRALAYVSRGLV